MSYQHQILGSVVTSVLNYDQFCKEIGETPAIDNKKSSYAPCDGRSIVGSQLEIKTNHVINTTPDLRGKFARGLNVMYSPGQPTKPFHPKLEGDPQDHRVVMDYQDNATRKPNTAFTGTTSDSGEHSHKIESDVYDHGSMIGNNTPTLGGGSYGFSSGTHSTVPNGNHNHTVTINAGGDDETRPRNISVYFYIKIN